MSEQRRRGKYPDELRERAVRMVYEAERDSGSQWEAISLVAHKLGPTPETVRKWVRRMEGDTGRRLRPPDRVHCGSARMPEEVPLFSPPVPPQDTDADPPRPSSDRRSRAGPATSRSRAAPAEPAGRSGPGVVSAGSAALAGPRAARSALSAARANQGVATAPFA